MITREFLQKKLDPDCRWGVQNGHVNKICDDVYKFDVYNLLPGTNPHGLDGMYSFYVDVTNFNYLASKFAGYRALTSVTPVRHPIFLDPPHESIVSTVEHLIANKLLHTCLYDRNATWNRGEFLIPFPKEAFPNGYPYEYLYMKICFMCDWVDRYAGEPLGELSDTDKIAKHILLNKRS